MTEANANEPLPPGEVTAETAVAEPPKPEPWTAEKVVEWNAYYDLFVAAIVLALCFFASANKLAQPQVWNHLQAGREISQTHSPITTDLHSYTEEGHRWVHVAWLADLIHYQVYAFAAGFAKVDPVSQVESKAPEIIQAKREQVEKTEQVGAAGLIGLSAFLRALTVFVLLRIRHKGPGLWWAAVCSALVLGVYLGPDGLVFGGVGRPAMVDPLTWSQLFLAIELLWLFRAFGQGRNWALYALPPLFLIWANFEESFLFGLLIFAAVAIGHALTKTRDAKGQLVPRTPCPKRTLVVVGVSAALCLLNPSLHLVYGAAFSTLFPSLGWVSGPPLIEQLSFFGKTVAGEQGASLWASSAYYLIIVGLGLASFALNYKRFRLGRALAFAVAAVLWAVVIRQQCVFAIVLAAILILNGQEWYQGLVGTEGRLGKNWTVFSTGGRAATLLLVAGAITLKLFNMGIAPSEPLFGFEFDPDDFRFESAQMLADAPIEGNIFNTSLPQGDALIWRASPKRKTFIDSRRHLFSAQTVDTFETLQKAIRDNDVPAARAILKQYKISALMIQISRSPRTYQALVAGKQWIPFYDDGAVVMFGQPEAPAADLAYYQKNRLDADNLVYKNPKPAPSSDKLPTPTTDLDKLYQTRSMSHSQSHTDSAGRWLRPADLDAKTPYIPTPADCLMAIRELREALLIKPNDSVAYGRLADVYQLLLSEESALLSGYQPTLENANIINNTPPQTGVLGNRMRQLITALNYAILTTPPPKTAEDHGALANLNLRLANYYYTTGCLDLARERLDAALKNFEEVKDIRIELITSLTRQLTDITSQFNEIQTRILNMPVDASSGPLQKAAFARSAGAIGLAIQFLEEAKDQGINPALIKPTLVDLYCQSGQPEKALELWQGGNTSDANLSDGPGTAAMRQGRVFLLLGNYGNAIQLMSREGIPPLKFEDALKAVQSPRTLLEGNPMSAARSLLELPDDVTKQALWEFELAMACLEGGVSAETTAEHLTRALTLAPDLTVRPIIEYHLKKLGKPIPPKPVPKKGGVLKAAAADPAQPAIVPPK